MGTQKQVVSVFFNSEHTGYDVFSRYHDTGYKGFCEAKDVEEMVLGILRKHAKYNPTVRDRRLKEYEKERQHI